MVTARVEVAVPPAVNEAGLVAKENVTPGTVVVVDAASVTFPEKPLMLVSATVDVPDIPAVKDAGVVAVIPIS